MPMEPWDSLNQKWANGPMGTNEVLETVSLDNNQLGPGMFSIKIVDMESKLNINLINESTDSMFSRPSTSLEPIRPILRRLAIRCSLDRYRRTPSSERQRRR